ncbi:MAG: AAA family ATPase [Mesorhizobium sp.]|nr:bifunctional aminoglycoside phosphotransferase/ATP-binding protein [Mesorhizobium sp.]MCO5162644.1 AAA family ATPase [Mesorhizobium sp.]
MITENQTDTIAFLADPAAHGLTEPVETIDTHISHVFLAGDRAFKAKRAVKLPYVDFSTPALRLAACRKEVELNSPTAPGLYLGVRRITREPSGRLAFDGKGDLVDAVVEMRRFAQSALLDQMAAAGTLSPALMTETASMIVRFHRSAPVIHAGGGAANMQGVLDINRAGFATSRVFLPDEVERFDAAFRKALARHAASLDRREMAGKVRRCHGDLHLRNICLLDGVPRLFDCIEFSDRIATVDVLYDLAFLLMDLWHRNLRELANLVMNRYLDEADDEDGFALLPFFMAVRAAVRAHVLATQAEESGDVSGKLTSEARSYFDLALGLLALRPPRLIAIGGRSGSGKTTIAEALAARIGAPPGARIVESDRIRKALHGVAAETHLPDKAYRPEVSERVYAEVAWRAGLILAEGGSVVADAVFDRPADRSRIMRSALDRGVPFQGIWLEADPDLLWQRVAGRSGGASDATVDILSRQLQRNAGNIDWHRLDAARSTGRIVGDIMALPTAAGAVER